MKWPLDFKDKIICGDNLEIMKQIPDGKIDMGMTSPPYWGLRDYGIEGQCGLEDTPEKYIDKMVIIFHELKRILKPSGSFFLNMGDSYGGHSGGYYPQKDELRARKRQIKFKGNNMPKCLCMIPERLAWALIEDGWILRNKIIWHKPNGMPSSAKDRFTNTWEYLFFFTKNQKYYFDLDAVREPLAESVMKGILSGSRNRRNKETGDTKGSHIPGQSPCGLDRKKHSGYFDKNGKCLVDFEKGKNPGDTLEIPSETRTMGAIIGHGGGIKVPGGKGWTGHPPGGANALKKDPRWCPPEGKNPGDFMEINTQPFPAAHFAVFPEKLCERPIKAACPPGGIVIDPFVGAGTTVFVANKLMRHGIGIDLSPKFCEMARRRISQKNLFIHNKPLQDTDESGTGNSQITTEGTDVAQQQLGNIIIHEIDKQIMED